MDEEYRTLNELLIDFKDVNCPEDFNQIFQIINTNDSNIPSIYANINILLTSKKDSLSIVYAVLIKAFHKILFTNIYSNAGDYRKSTEPNGGEVFFGREDKTGSYPLFKGVDPNKIEDEVMKACKFLIMLPDDPLENALRFFQRFLRIHPFYDANGRIGRHIVNIYLQRFNLFINWENILNKEGRSRGGQNNKGGKYVRKLTQCHKFENNSPQYEIYFGYMLSFYQKHLKEIPQET